MFGALECAAWIISTTLTHRSKVSPPFPAALSHPGSSEGPRTHLSPKNLWVWSMTFTRCPSQSSREGSGHKEWGRGAAFPIRSQGKQCLLSRDHRRSNRGLKRQLLLACALPAWKVPIQFLSPLRLGNPERDDVTQSQEHLASHVLLPTTFLAIRGTLPSIPVTTGRRDKGDTPRQSQPLQGLLLAAKVLKGAFLCGKGFCEGGVAAKSVQLRPRRAGGTDK